MPVRNKTADILYQKMLQTTPQKVGITAIKAMNAIQCDSVENQILSVGALLVTMLDQYQLNATEVLGVADNMVYSAAHNNMAFDFKALKNYMKNEWEI